MTRVSVGINIIGTVQPVCGVVVTGAPGPVRRQRLVGAVIAGKTVAALFADPEPVLQAPNAVILPLKRPARVALIVRRGMAAHV